jgi:hypothetical protein
MKSTRFTVAAALILAGAPIAQDLLPEVLLLSRVKHHIQDELQHLVWSKYSNALRDHGLL